MPQISKGLRQAYDLQDFTYEAAMSLKNTLKLDDGTLKIAREDAQSIAALVKSWEACQQRIQVHRGKPNPGSLRPVAQPSKKPKRKVTDSPASELPSPPTPTEETLPEHEL